MRIGDILKIESITTQLTASDKEETIEKLVDLLVKSHDLDGKDVILQAVLEREKLMSTGVGKGVAIPHGKSDSLDNLVASFALLNGGVDFGSPDGIPVRIVILMVASSQNTGPHIRALAHISRLLQDEEVREKLLQAKSSNEIVEIFEEREEELGS